jgi:hypothetical protein
VRRVVIMRLVSVRREWDVGEGIGIYEMWEEGRAKKKDVDARPEIPELKCIRSCGYLSIKALLVTKIVMKKSNRSCVVLNCFILRNEYRCACPPPTPPGSRKSFHSFRTQLPSSSSRSFPLNRWTILLVTLPPIIHPGGPSFSADNKFTTLLSINFTTYSSLPGHSNSSAKQILQFNPCT